MASDHTTISITCPACREPIALNSRTAYEAGRMVIRFDTAPVREHITAHHASGPTAGPAPDPPAPLADRIRALHTPSTEAIDPGITGGLHPICEGCSAGNPWEAHTWPCPTLDLLDQEDQCPS